MGNENGTWVMYGVDWDDPECIHTVEGVAGRLNRNMVCFCLDKSISKCVIY